MGHDIIVLGSGPAGLAAALAARGRDKTVLVIGNRWQDSPLAKAELVDNYLGVSGQSGIALMQTFYDHASAAGAEFVVGRAISLMVWNGFMVTVGSQVYDGRALILAPGVQRQAKYPGETEFLGRGVSYCATCDGMLYRGKPIVVVGRSADAPLEANYLHSLGCQVVYVSPQEPVGLDQGIPFLRAGRLAVKGEERVTALTADGVDIPCDGIFILRQAVASNDLLPDLEMENGAIRVDRRMATNLPGVFAAGDCTGAPLQIAKAVGEGHVAALSACEYLDAAEKTQPQQ
jgi:thioredoxin reductase (NADPH)